MPVQTNAGPLDDNVYTILRKKWVEGHPDSQAAEVKLKVVEAQEVPFNDDPKVWFEACQTKQGEVNQARKALKSTRDGLEETFDVALGVLKR